MKFPKLVIEEATALRKNATKTEIDKLNFLALNAHSATSCVYGLMTGDCHSERAIELIKSCAKRVYKTGEGLPHEGCKLNGSPVELKRKTSAFEVAFWSPIEVFISKSQTENKSELNKKLIQFIKGEIKTL